MILEDAEQLEKIRKVRDQLPNLEHVIAIEPIEADDMITLDDAARARPRARGGLRASASRRSSPSDVATYIYTSGTTGPPKGCIIDHANWRDMLDMIQAEERAGRARGRPTSSCRSPTRSPG